MTDDRIVILRGRHHARARYQGAVAVALTATLLTLRARRPGAQ